MNVGEKGIDWDWDENGQFVWLDPCTGEPVEEGHPDMDDPINSLQENE